MLESRNIDFHQLSSSDQLHHQTYLHFWIQQGYLSWTSQSSLAHLEDRIGLCLASLTTLIEKVEHVSSGLDLLLNSTNWNFDDINLLLEIVHAIVIKWILSIKSSARWWSTTMTNWRRKMISAQWWTSSLIQLRSLQAEWVLSTQISKLWSPKEFWISRRLKSARSHHSWSISFSDWGRKCCFLSREWSGSARRDSLLGSTHNWLDLRKLWRVARRNFVFCET